MAIEQQAPSDDDAQALEESLRDLQLTGAAYPDVELLPEGLLPSDTCSQYDEATRVGRQNSWFGLLSKDGHARMSSTGVELGARVCNRSPPQLSAMSSTGFEGTQDSDGQQHFPEMLSREGSAQMSSTGFEGVRACEGSLQQLFEVSSTGLEGTQSPGEQSHLSGSNSCTRMSSTGSEDTHICGGTVQQPPEMSSTGFEGGQTPENEPRVDHRDLPALRRAKAKITVKLQDKGLRLVLRGRLVGMLALLNLYLDDDLHFGWMKASLFAAKSAGKGTNFARNLRYWVLLLVRYGIFPVRKRSKAVGFLPQGEDLSQLIHLHLLEISKEGHIRAQDIVTFLQTPAMRAHIGSDKGLSIRGAQRWMQQMGWRYGMAKNGMYKDGHESPEVVEYREAFCNRWVTDYAPRMHAYGNNGELVSNPSTVDLQNGRFPLILVTHDESTFYANDRRKTGWYHPDASVPQPKGEGQSIMVSDFLTPNWGRLRDNEQ